jgi:hypothetical protein
MKSDAIGAVFVTLVGGVIVKTGAASGCHTVQKLYVPLVVVATVSRRSSALALIQPHLQRLASFR